MKQSFKRDYSISIEGLLGDEFDKFDKAWDEFMKFVDLFDSKQNLVITRSKK